jgi:hypothetical protein
MNSAAADNSVGCEGIPNRDVCRYGLMVEHVLAKDDVGVRFPLPAPRKTHHESGGFFLAKLLIICIVIIGITTFMEQYRPEQRFNNPDKESLEHLDASPEQGSEVITTSELSSEQAAVDSLLGIDHQEMADPMTFWGSFADLELVSSRKSEQYNITGTYRELKLDISLSITLPVGAFGVGFKVNRYYTVYVDGQRLNPEDSKIIAEHFRHILNAREKFLGLIHRA